MSWRGVVRIGHWSRVASESFARFTSKEDATAAAVVLMRSTETLLSRPGRLTRTASQGPWTLNQSCSCQEAKGRAAHPF